MPLDCKALRLSLCAVIALNVCVLRQARPELGSGLRARRVWGFSGFYDLLNVNSSAVKLLAPYKLRRVLVHSPNAGCLGFRLQTMFESRVKHRFSMQAG